jgi:hypothetical protein
MGDFLRFETMITPAVIQIVFWIAVVIILIAGIAQLFQGGWAALTGLLTIVLGPIVARIYCELVIVFFRINDHVRGIEINTRHP